MKIPETQKAAVIRQGRGLSFEITTVPVPELGPTDLLVKLSATGICGTDLALASGKLGPCCRILGHEGIGRVVKIGVGLREGSVKIGDRVGVSWVRDSCAECVMCLHGEETRCVKQIHSGRVVDGTLAQYTVVPFRHLICLPEGLPDEQLAPIMCAGVTAYKALKICGAVPGQWVAISGAGGGVGAMAIQYAHAMGYRVLAIDAGEQKSGYCLRLQAEAYVNVLEHQNIGSVVNDITGNQGAAAVLVAAGSAQAYEDAFGMLAAFGTLVCIGIPAPSQRVMFHPLNFIDKGIRVIGSMVGSRGDMNEAFQFVQRRLVIPEVQTIGMDDLPSLDSLFTSHQVSPLPHL
ncbi:chaperonin 10-like protein [Aspergillus sergii]|uniref:Chaperonin 10-like protein n=1 Tax=Aspergillus sergii TaxID=1034303 RepID=A0A5N6X2T4_9EURO|nr:chaperonin 10-like protein [Aspergillus sergii]